MEFIVKVNKLEDVYLIDNADAYLLANKSFSYRYDESFSLSKIKKVLSYCKKNNKKAYILINKIFKDSELENLKTFINELVLLKIDGIFFADFAVFMYAEKLNYADKCYFYHETFLRNCKDILTYQEYGIKNIVCSKDMNLEDIKNLPIERKNTYGILCFGYIPLYESARKIISNFVKNYNLDKNLINSTTLTLKENTREDHYKVLQQNGTSSIFDSKVLSYLPYMKELSTNISYFIVDQLFFDNKYIKQVIELFKKATNEKIISEELKKLDEKLEFSDGFLNSRIGLM